MCVRTQTTPDPVEPMLMHLPVIKVFPPPFAQTELSLKRYKRQLVVRLKTPKVTQIGIPELSSK